MEGDGRQTGNTNNPESVPVSARQRFEWTLDPPKDGSFKAISPILSVRDDGSVLQDEQQSLSEFRESEGRLNRLARLKSVFENLSPSASGAAAPSATSTSGDPSEKEAELLRQRTEARQAYASELWVAVGGRRGDAAAAQKRPEWGQFAEYAEKKEAELWQVFQDIDRDHNGRLNEQELRDAVSRAGVEVSPEFIKSFLRTVDKDKDGSICFKEWRDFLLLLPRPADLPEILRYYSARSPTRIAASQVTQDGDVTMGASGSGWARGRHGLASELGLHVGATSQAVARDRETGMDLRDDPLKGQGAVALSAKAEGKRKAVDLHEDAPESSSEETDTDGGSDQDDNGSTSQPWEGAGKFLLAGGIAGAVSRTATAPFDRLKIYLINDDSPSHGRGKPGSSAGTAKGAFKELKSAHPVAVASTTAEATKRGTLNLVGAIKAIYVEGGLKGFFVGNGLNVLKIFPESACKFLVYELCKRGFAKYVDDVPDQSQISGTSRFISGGIGGVMSQFAIYPVETLKTRVMSGTSTKLVGNALLKKTAKDMWKEGRAGAYYRGLVPALIGVFPYSAIDMSAFEALKKAWVKTLGDEPGIIGTLTCGAISGGVGATTVYPLNLIRTRLQSQGSPSHPQRYTGIRDCAVKTYQNEGLRSLYKGLSPSLLKVVPAMSLSWLTYDYTTRLFNVGHNDGS